MRSAAACALLWIAHPGANAQEQQPRWFFQVGAGLGVDLHAASSISHYINTVALPSTEVAVAGTGVEFFVVPELQVAETWSVGLDYSYLLVSRNVQGAYGNWEFTYRVQMPTLFVHYLILGPAYRLGFGGGIGVHFATFEQTFQSYGSVADATAKGLAGKIDATLNLMFDEHFYGLIAVEARISSPGDLKTGDGQALTSVAGTVNGNFYSAGVKFGMAYAF